MSLYLLDLIVGDEITLKNNPLKCLLEAINDTRENFNKWVGEVQKCTLCPEHRSLCKEIIALFINLNTQIIAIFNASNSVINNCELEIAKLVKQSQCAESIKSSQVLEILKPLLEHDFDLQRTHQEANDACFNLRKKIDHFSVVRTSLTHKQKHLSNSRFWSIIGMSFAYTGVALCTAATTAGAILAAPIAIPITAGVSGGVVLGLGIKKTVDFVWSDNELRDMNNELEKVKISGESLAHINKKEEILRNLLFKVMSGCNVLDSASKLHTTKEIIPLARLLIIDANVKTVCQIYANLGELCNDQQFHQKLTELQEQLK